jgi:hypothetical protein
MARVGSKRWSHSLSLISAVSCPLLATLSPSGGRACSFSIERAPQINLRRWPPLLAHILYDALAALKVRYGVSSSTATLGKRPEAALLGPSNAP